MAVFENRSGAYFMYVSSGCAEKRHLQAAMAIFGSGSEAHAAFGLETASAAMPALAKRRIIATPVAVSKRRNRP